MPDSGTTPFPIVEIHRVEGNAHYGVKREQERLVAAGPVPWTIVPATQSHDFAEMVATWTAPDGIANIAPLLVQPIAPADLAEVLAEIVAAEPQGSPRRRGRPEPQELVDMARRTFAARGRTVKLVPTRSTMIGSAMAGDVMLPGGGARIAPTTFDEWLAQQRCPRAISRG